MRDTLIFVTLTCVTLVLYGVTLALFRSFEGHRTDLGIYWSDHGKDEMLHGHPEQAANSLRNAISFAPDDRQYELLLAQALAESGQTDQAMSYFMNLRDVQPGDGFINLELARLFRKKGLSEQAVTYYHAAIFGDWQTDGTIRRRKIRLELADYLASIHNMSAARAELLIASGNASNDPYVSTVLGNRFAAIGDDADALNSYRRALQIDPEEPAALEAAGRISLKMGNYRAAHAFFQKDLQEQIHDSARKEEVLALAEEAGRFEELAVSANLPNHVRAEHLMLGRSIAEARLTSCSAQLGDATQQPVNILDLKQRWKAVQHITLRNLENDETLQESLWNLIGDTESITAKVCGAPAGDNAILLTLARHESPNQ